MKSKIIRLLSIINVESKERQPVFYLLFQAFFIGTFNGFLYIYAHAGFLKSEDVDKLPEALVMSGAMSLFVVLLYQIFISNFSFKTAKIFFSIIIGIAIIGLLTINNFIPVSHYGFFLFTAIFPIQIISLQKFNSTLNHYFPGKQSVRFSRTLHNSRELGFVFMGFLLPLLLFTSIDMGTMLNIGLSSYIAHLIFEFLFIRSGSSLVQESPKKHFRFLNTLSNKFVRQLAWFLLLSYMIGFLIHYAFIVITNDNFQSSVGLIKFFGIFMSTMIVFSFFADKYLLNRILNNLGLPYSIVLSPIFIGIFIVMASLIGLKSGFNNAVSGYTFVFLFFAAGKYIEHLFKFSVETPSSNILLTSVKSLDIDSVKLFVQGPVVASALLFSGLIVFLQSIYLKFNLLYLALFIVVLSVFWFLSAVKLIKRYRNNLKLRYAEIDQEKNVKEYLSLPVKYENLIFSNFKENNDEKSLYILKFIKSVLPIAYFKFIPNYINPHRNEEIIRYLLREIKRYDLLQAIPDLYDFKLTRNNELKMYIEEIISSLNEKPMDNYHYETAVDIIYSSNIKDKKKLLRAIGEGRDEDIDKLLPLILRDIEPDVVFLAMILAKNMKSEKCLETISSYLLSEVYYNLAYDVLTHFGDSAIPHLEELYYSDDITPNAMIRIIRLMGDINSNVSIEQLLEKLDEVDFKLKKETVLSLRKLKFKATDEQANQIIRHIVRAVENCSWNMSVQLKFRTLENNELLIEAMNSEINENYDLIFGLLSLLYDQKKLNYIYNLIKDGNSETLTYAIEMMDFILDEDLKNIIFPLFENSPYPVKINQLQYYFAIELSRKEANLKKVINRESNLLSNWTKTCAIIYVQETKNTVLNMDLIASMFHPEYIIRETAAFAISLLDKDAFLSAYERLSDAYRSELDMVLENAKESREHLVFWRILKLKSDYGSFRDIPFEQLVQFVSAFEYMFLGKEEVLNIPDDEQMPLIWLFSGSLKINTKLHMIYNLEENSLTDLSGIPNIQNVIARDNTKIYMIKRNKLNELLFENRELMKAFLKFMDTCKIFQHETLNNHYEKVMV